MKCVIDFLNVGFGEATVIRIIDGEQSFCLVVDGGDVDSLKNSRRCSLEQYVREHAIEKIDVLILTHFHKDHIGGVLAMLGKLPIEQMLLHVILPIHIMQSDLDDHSTPMLASLSLYKMLLTKANRLGIPMRLIKERHTFNERGVSFSLLTPDQGKLQLLCDELDKLDMAQLDQQQQRLSHIDRLLNETALAVLIRHNGESAALLTSDVGLDFWEPYEGEIGRVRLLQAPHHGDAGCISQRLLKSLSPQMVVVSADDEGTYQLPQPEFEAFIREHSQAEVYYTEAEASTHRIIRIDINDWRLDLIR